MTTRKFNSQAEFDMLPESDRLGSVLYGTFYYACVHTPNLSAMKKFNADPAYTIQLGLDEENVQKAQELGLKVKDPTENIPEPHVDLKRKVDRWDEETKTAYSKKGKEVSIEVVDGMQNPVPSTILIGNGSKGYVKFARYFYDVAGSKGVGTSLYKMQVVELERYSPPKDADFVTSTSGFNVTEEVAAADDVPFDVTEGKVAVAGGGSVAVSNASSLFDD